MLENYIAGLPLYTDVCTHTHVPFLQMTFGSGLGLIFCVFHLGQVVCARVTRSFCVSVYLVFFLLFSRVEFGCAVNCLERLVSK